jgi:catechol 2,3-dioxygenase-like lactoylglutathione lyase family enzyme
MINALQHVGQGVRDVDTTYEFYKRNFGYKVKLNDLTVASKELEAVLGSVETMRMMMALNVKGGGILELIEHKSKPISSLPEGNIYGHYGILEIGYGVLNIEKVVSDFQSRGVKMLTPIHEIDLGGGRRWRYAYLKDPDGLPLQLTEDLLPGTPASAKAEVHGVSHVSIGVSNLERSIAFYQSTLEFDRLVCEFESLVPEKNPAGSDFLRMKMAILERSADVRGPLAGLLPRGAVKLIEIPAEKARHIYEGRPWGDVGCMEFCLDVSDLLATIEVMKEKGVEIYLPPMEMSMGTGSKGFLAYIRDPDGTTVEFVEVQSIFWLSATRFMRLAMPLLRLYDRLSPG